MIRVFGSGGRGPAVATVLATALAGVIAAQALETQLKSRSETGGTMRILEINRDDDDLLQGFVRATWPGRSELVTGAASGWLQTFLRSAALWYQMRPLSAGLRVMVEPGRPIETLHSFVVDRRDEQRLRLVLAAFTRTDNMASGTTECLSHGVELEGRFLHPHGERLAVNDDALATAHGLAIYPHHRLADQLPRLLATFTDLSIAIGYEMQVAPWSPERESLRQVLHNHSRLASTSGIPPHLVQDQTNFAELVKAADYHMEECLWVPPGQPKHVVEDTLREILRQRVYATLGGEQQIEDLGADGRGRGEAFAHHVHSHVIDGGSDHDDVGGALTRQEVDRYLSCRMIAESLGDILPAGSEDTGPLARILGDSTPSGAPSAGGHGTNRPFLFVSYARDDSDDVYPLIDRLTGQGAHVWHDQRLIGGDQWLAELEAQLMSCSGVIAFISPSFAASRYCCREVRFADALNKPIIPAVLGQAELGSGLNFILHGSQHIVLAPNDDGRGLLAAMRSHTPNVLQ